MIEVPGYKIIRILGKGGMASVYLAIQESFEREVALKVVNPTLSGDSKFTERFLREAKIVSQVVHPNIVTVYEVGVHDNRHYLSMEYIPGLDLKRKRKFLTLPQGIRVVKDIAKALDYASKKGYVHRDVKPENIMLHEDDGRAVLMDFGIACLADTTSGMTQTGTAIGTPHYMSPEQAKGRTVDSRSDIYSLGVVFFLMMTGHVPYDADSAVAVGIKHVSEPVPRLPKHLRILQPIIDKVLAKNPAERYQNGAELAAALDALTEEDLRTIGVLASRAPASRSNTEGNTGRNTAGNASAGQSAVSVKRSAPKNSPDHTTMAAAALPTQDGQKAVSDDTGNTDEESNHSIANRVTGRTGPIKNDTNKTRAVRRGSPISAGRSGSHLSVTGGGTTAAGEIVSIDEEDRRISDSRTKIRWPLWLVAILIVAVSGVVYFKQQLPPPMAATVDQVVQQLLDVRDELYTAAGWEVPPARDSVLPNPEVVAVQTDDKMSSGDQPPLADNETESQSAESQADVSSSNQARELRSKLDNDLSVAPQLAQNYRDTLATSPGDRSADWGLTELKDYHFRHIRDELEAWDLVAAHTYMDSLNRSFPDIAADPRYQQTLDLLDSATETQQLVTEGDSYFEQDLLMAPAGGNALESYRQALKTDEGNPAAKAGIDRIAGRYAELAQAEIDDKQWITALDMANRGLALAPDNLQLDKLHKQASEARNRQRDVENLLASAEKELDAGHLITPREGSAYQQFRKSLDIDSGNTRANRGLTEVEQKLGQQVEASINRNEFEQAQEILRNAGQLYPSSERFLALKVSLEKAIEADFVSRQPKISQMLVSNEMPTGIDQVQKSTLNVDRTLYIGFSFANFKASTSVVHAVLYDGSRTVQIAQVPIVISGEEGVKFFPIERPVEGFAPGGYNIDLMLNQDQLSTLAFRVSAGE